MNNVVALTLRAEAVRRKADGYDEVWNTFFTSVRPIMERDAAMCAADSHVRRLMLRDEKILAGVATALTEPEHA